MNDPSFVVESRARPLGAPQGRSRTARRSVPTRAAARFGIKHFVLTFLFCSFFVAPLSAQVSTQISPDAPIVNFRLPTFTPDGYRAWLVRGSEARMISKTEIDVRELTMTVFTGDAADRITTMLLSPQARVFPTEQRVTGSDTLRVIDDEFEATGAQWHYDHREKRVFIAKDVRVTFRAELKDLLQ